VYPAVNQSFHRSPEDSWKAITGASGRNLLRLLIDQEKETVDHQISSQSTLLTNLVK
jgi:hypothetical protein